MLEEHHVPAPALLRVALAQRAKEAGPVGDGERHDLPHALRGEQRTEVGGGRAPVVADDDGVVGGERVEQGGDVLAERHGVEASVDRRGGGCVAAHERRDDTVARLHEDGDLMTPRASVVGESVQAEHQRAAAALERLERHVRGLDRARDHRPGL